MEAILNWITELMNTIGAPGVGIAILLENLFPPIPSEVVLPLAGFTVVQGELNLVNTYVWSVLGSWLGALLLYWVGAAVGADRLRSVADWMWGTRASDVDNALAWFDKYGTASVFFGRLVPGVRSLISIPAGVNRMNLVTFSLWTIFGSGIWNALLIGLGVVLGEAWDQAVVYVDRYSTVVYIILAVLIVAGIVWLIRREQKEKQEKKEKQNTVEATEVDTADTTK